MGRILYFKLSPIQLLGRSSRTGLHVDRAPGPDGATGPDTFLSVTDDDAVAWAEALFERRWREADPIPS